MKKKNGYVPTTLDQFINESQTINLKRGYRGQPPVSVGAKAPVRDQILQYVAECRSISRKELRTFIAGLNESSKRPMSSANMWLKRNEKFFITENRNGKEVFKLSTIGKRLVNRIDAISEAESVDNHDFIDTKKGYPRPGINDSIDEDEDEDEEVNESRLEKLQRILEIADRKSILNEEKEVESSDELSFDDLDLGDEDDSDDLEDDLEDDSDDLDLGDEDDDLEDDDDVDKVEISEFIITVDNAAEAIAELEALGISAESVGGDDDMDLEDEDEFDTDMDLEDEDEFDTDMDLEDDDFNLEGDELELEEGAEIGTNIIDEDGEDDNLEARISAIEDKVQNLESGGDLENDMDLEDEDEFESDGDMNLEDDGDMDLEDEDDMDLEDEDDMDLEDEDETVELGSQEIRVSAEDFPALKGWLESKGVNVDDVLGGEVEVEGEDEDLEVADEEDSDFESGDLGDDDSDDEDVDEDKEVEDK